LPQLGSKLFVLVEELLDGGSLVGEVDAELFALLG
jgi:hypothetical protein